MSRKILNFFKKSCEAENSKDLSKSQLIIQEHSEILSVANDDAQSPSNLIKDKVKIENCQEYKIILPYDSSKMMHKNNPIDAAKFSSCQFCKKSFKYKTSLQNHMKNVHPDKSDCKILPCTICGIKYVSMFALEQHIKIKHYNGKANFYECDFDGETFLSKSQMHVHMRIHQLPIKCKLCKAILKPSSMRLHLQQTHATERIFKCKFCPKTSKSAVYLRSHEKIHSKRFECKICCKMFSRASYSNQHMRDYHENPRSYACKFCDKKFNRKFVLTQHEKSHNKYRQKRFKCQRCNYSTDKTDHFQMHMYYHEKKDKKIAAMINPLICEECQKLCKNERALNAHVRNVHRAKIVQCDLCGKYLKSMKNLLFHLKVHLQQQEDKK